jgi:hypothetical protein
MKNVTPLRLGVFGAFWLVAGFAWLAFWFIYVRPPDSPALSNDFAVPILPRMISLFGILIVIAALGWAITVRFRSRRARS